MPNTRTALHAILALGLLAAPAALVMTSCSSSPSVGTGQMEGVKDFSYTVFATTEHAIPSTGTFGWGPRFFKVEYVEGSDLSGLDARVRRSLRAELEARGYTFSEENPDLLVGYGVAMNAPIDESILNGMYGEEFDFTFEADDVTTSRNYQRGTIVVDFLDASTSTLLWRGIARGGFDLEVSAEDKDERARHVAQLLIGRFPDPAAAN